MLILLLRNVVHRDPRHEVANLHCELVCVISARVYSKRVCRGVSRDRGMGSQSQFKKAQFV
jgi:hypothetical protein